MKKLQNNVSLFIYKWNIDRYLKLTLLLQTERHLQNELQLFPYSKLFPVELNV